MFDSYFYVLYQNKYLFIKNNKYFKMYVILSHLTYFMLRIHHGMGGTEQPSSWRMDRTDHTIMPCHFDCSLQLCSFQLLNTDGAAVMVLVANPTCCNCHAAIHCIFFFFPPSFFLHFSRKTICPITIYNQSCFFIFLDFSFFFFFCPFSWN